MLETYQQVLKNDFFIRALLCGTLIGFSNGFFSGFVNLRKQALSVSALSHTMLPGIVISIWLTGQLTQVNAFMGAVFASLMVGLGSMIVSRNSRIPQGTSLAVFYTSAFAAGVAALPHLPVQTELEHWLFGNIMLISESDFMITFFSAAVTLLFSTLFMRPLLLTLFEPNVAAAQGVPTRAMQYLCFTMLILMLVSSLQAVGCALSVGLLVGPSAVMLFYTNNTNALFWGGGFIGAMTSIGGILISVALDIAPGPAILIVLGVVFILAFITSPRYGLLSNRIKRHKH